MEKFVIVYVPVLHEGYRKFFLRHADASIIYIFGEEVTNEFDYLRKDIRALQPELIKAAIDSWGLNQEVLILNRGGIEKIKAIKAIIVMPREDVNEELAQKYFADKKIEYDSIFLRWDRHNSLAEKPVTPDTKISKEDFDKEMIAIALKESEKSSDFWRHVGAAIVKDRKIIAVAHNKHLPSEQNPYVNGDPRNAFKKGINIDISTAIHAEAKIIAEAAARGISLEGSSIYITTFPCPTCAKLIAYAGIKKLYSLGGYAVLDGEVILRNKGIEIIFVE